MRKTLLAVSHLRQRAEADCLPVCAQMVLAYLGRHEPYERLAQILGTHWFGTPADNILRLEQIGVRVTLAELTLNQIEEHLRGSHPVIAYVNTSDLPYWDVAADHVVVVVGVDEDTVFLNDPYLAQAPQIAPRHSFELSMLRFDSRCVILEV